MGSQVRAVKNDSESRIEKEKAQADNVPLGILLPGDTNSPDILAPDIIPVTPERMQNSKKLTFTILGLPESVPTNILTSV